MTHMFLLSNRTCLVFLQNHKELGAGLLLVWCTLIWAIPEKNNICTIIIESTH